MTKQQKSDGEDMIYAEEKDRFSSCSPRGTHGAVDPSAKISYNRIKFRATFSIRIFDIADI